MIDHFDDLDTGWSWVVMLACFVSLFVIGGTNYTVGLIHSTLLQRFHQNQGTTALVGSLHTAIMNLAGPLSSILVDRFSVRVAIVTSGIMFTVGYMCTAFAPSIEVAIVTCGIVSGLGGAFGWTASMIAPGFYFRKYRNAAIGFSMSGTGVGIFGLPPVLQWAADNFGSFGFFVCLSCFTMQIIGCGFAMIPSKLEKYVHQRRFQENSNSKTSSFSKSCISFLQTYSKVLANKTVTCLSFSMFLYCFGSYIVFLHLPSFCTNGGTTAMQASFVLSICGAVSVAGRFLTGAISSIPGVKEIWLYGGSMVIFGIITTLFPLFSHTYHGQLIYAAVIGLVFGTPFVTATPINISYLGISNMAIAIGIELCIGGIGAMIGPVLAGVILDKGTSYTVIFEIAGATSILGGLIAEIPLTFRNPLSDAINHSNDKEIEINEPMLCKDEATEKTD